MTTNMEDERFCCYNSDGTFNEKWTMIDLLTSKTGLPTIVFVINKNSVSDDNGPRIRVACHPTSFVDTSKDLTSFFFGETYVKGGFDAIIAPYIFAQIETFIVKNRKLLLDFWNERIGTVELRDGLEKI